MNWTDIVSAISSAISALASLLALAGVVLAILTYRNDLTERKSREVKEAIRTANQIGAAIDQAVKRKMDLERDLPNQIDPFSYEHISSNPDIENAVFTILNQYENLCLMTNIEELPLKEWEQLRGDAFKETLRQYDSYIDKYIQTTGSENAWKQCRELYKRIRKA